MEQSGRGPFVMLVEADPVLGLDLTDALEAAGYLVAGPIRSAVEAEAWLACLSPALAILDLAAADGAGTRLAQGLQARGVPFLIHAEPDTVRHRSGALADVPWLEKPAWHRDVVATVGELAARAGLAGARR